MAEAETAGPGTVKGLLMHFTACILPLALNAETNPISEKTYQARGLDDEPTIHEGYAARKLEKQGGIAERCEHNRRVRRRNSTLSKIQSDIHGTMGKIKKLEADSKKLKKLARFVYGEQDQQQGQEIGR